MSDFLQFVDRIPTLPNRKKLTFENDGSVKYATVEYADQPIEEGTFLNKAYFNVLNSSLGYNETSVTQESIILPIGNQKLFFEDVDPTWNSTGGIGSLLSGNMSSVNDEVLGTYTPSYTITPLNESTQEGQFNASASYSSTRKVIGIGTHYNSTNYTYTSNNFINVLKNTDVVSNNNINFTPNDVYDRMSIIFDFDFKQNATEKIIKLNASPIKDLFLYVSNDNVTWTLFDSKNNVSGDYAKNIGEYQYCRLKLSWDIDRLVLNYLYVNINKSSSVINNKILINGYNFEKINNKRVLIYTPDTLDLTNVETNTINNIFCDTLLQPNSKYELIYNEIKDKFELGKLSEFILFDITLNEAVNQVDLTGISNMIKIGKLYMCQVLGSMSTAGTYGISAVNNAGYLSTEVNKGFYGGITFFWLLPNDNGVYINTIYNSNNNTIAKGVAQKLNENEYLKCNSNYTFNVGTRIIIKEVA